MVTIAHEQNIVCSKIRLDGNKCDKTSFCRQLFAGHVVGSQPRKMTKNMNQMIIIIIIVMKICLVWMDSWLGYCCSTCGSGAP